MKKNKIIVLTIPNVLVKGDMVVLLLSKQQDFEVEGEVKHIEREFCRTLKKYYMSNHI